MKRPPTLLSLVTLGTIFTCALQAESRVFEAEQGRLVGATEIGTQRAGFAGKGYVTHFATDADAVDITVSVPTAGFYTLSYRYAADSDKYNPVFVRGAFQGKGYFAKTEGFETHAFGRIRLDAGDTVIRIGKEWGGIDLDSLLIEPAPEPVAFHLSDAPVNPQASPEARKLLRGLNAVFQKKILSGQHYLDDMPYIAGKSGGREPLIAGFDMMYYSGAWKESDGDGSLEKAIDWHRNQQGLVSFCWHWYSPWGSTDKIWNSFYAAKTDFDVSRILDEHSKEYAAVVADIDRIAARLTVLRDAHVPVLWRPLHEAEGRWFWWGVKGPEAAKKLYRLMYDRFTRIHKLDNLLWVWTTTDSPQALDWYPGDDCVDIVGADIYPPKGALGACGTVFDNLRRIYGGRKLIALSENGVLPDPEILAKDEIGWLWFLTWNGYVSDPVQNPPELVKKTFTSDRVMVLGQKLP